jgi:hypothetical protein
LVLGIEFGGAVVHLSRHFGAAAFPLLGRWQHQASQEASCSAAQHSPLVLSLVLDVPSASLAL